MLGEHSFFLTHAMMKKIIFATGSVLLLLSTITQGVVHLGSESLVLFGLLILIAFFDDLEEFDFFGLKGRRVERELADIKQRLGQTAASQATNLPEDNLTKLRKKKVQLMGVDRGNFLALVFEIERLLRAIALELNPAEIEQNSPISQVATYLAQNGYLTASGHEQWKALSEVRNIIVQGRYPTENDAALSDWIELAYSLYSEIYDDLVSKPKVSKKKK